MSRKQEIRVKEAKKVRKRTASDKAFESFNATVAGTLADSEQTTATLAAKIEHRLTGSADQANEIAQGAKNPCAPSKPTSGDRFELS